MTAKDSITEDYCHGPRPLSLGGCTCPPIRPVPPASRGSEALYRVVYITEMAGHAWPWQHLLTALRTLRDDGMLGLVAGVERIDPHR